MNAQEFLALRITETHEAAMTAATVELTRSSLILAAHEPTVTPNGKWVCSTCMDVVARKRVAAPCPTLLAMLTPYLDHPDFQEIRTR